ncbi:hypothetical protein NCAS_0H01030 [Naumovozyma castellii]|uniref:AMP-activated protein kinase glycogen-binding domain-containing protein n=1 Tax=Naumovozyma castellii TaxID=27288 RepID=G0VIT6_NAUCA|nr:hypothetical protein NCAS_0H01030 [Naumovozyma castellii CBS 4309]CCC71413.1 hypothetical protein NCAS_0H01030 [Naumovozyma castellii CBS 4309]
MVKIIFGESSNKFHALQIAGSFSQWGTVPMDLVNGQWTYQINESKLEPGTKKLFFKFVDDSGNWFVDGNFPIEVDEHNNENNVMVLEQDKEGTAEILNDEGPETPAPSLRVGVVDGDKEVEVEVEEPTVHEPTPEMEEEEQQQEDREDEPTVEETTPALETDLNRDIPEPTVEEETPEPIVKNTQAMAETEVEDVTNEQDDKEEEEPSVSPDIQDESEEEVHSESLEEDYEMVNAQSSSSGANATSIKTTPLEPTTEQAVANVSTIPNPDTAEYRSLLRRILDVFGKIFGSWFFFFRSHRNENDDDNTALDATD